MLRVAYYGTNLQTHVVLPLVLAKVQCRVQLPASRGIVYKKQKEMSYRGPALTYQIRKTTIGNKTGDNFSITIPRIIAQQFQDIYFRLSISGTCLIFESGCKLTVSDITEEEVKKFFIGGGPVVFK